MPRKKKTTRRPKGAGSRYFDASKNAHVHRFPDGRKISRADPVTLEREVKRVLEAEKLGLDVKWGKATFAQLAEAWLIDTDKRVKPRTLRDYVDCMAHAVRQFGSRKAKDLTHEDMTKAWQALQGTGLSAASVARIRRVVSIAFSWGVVRKAVPGNPVTGSIVPQGPVLEKPVWTEDQCAIWLSGIQGHVYQTIFECLTLLAMRVSEVLGITTEGIDFEARLLPVTQQLAWNSDTQTFSLETLKTRSSRRVLPTPEKLLEGFAREKAVQAERKLAMGHGAWQDTLGLLFTSRTGRPIHHSNVLKAMVRLCKKLGLPRMTPHGLRRTWISNALAAGEPAIFVRDMAGHSSLATTDKHYSKTTPEWLRGVSSRTAERLSSGSRVHQKGTLGPG